MLDDHERAERQLRKQLVFPIMYGWHAGATGDELLTWRTMAADFINQEREDIPLTLESFRAYQRELSPDPCGCQGDCIMEHSSHVDEMRLCPYFPKD